MLTNHKVKTLTIGFIGADKAGRKSMKVLMNNPDLRINGVVVEQNSDNLIKAAEIAPRAKYLKTSKKLYKSNVDGIVIATPGEQSFSQCMEALDKGIPVFSQKPLCSSLTETRSILEIAKRKDKLIAVGFPYSYTRAFQAVLETIKSGEIGKLRQINLKYYMASGPDQAWSHSQKQQGSGCVMDLGVNLIDLALLALDYPEISVVESHLFSRGKLFCPREKKVEDYAMINMITQQGTIISLSCSWNLPVGKAAVIEAEYFGSEGGVAFKNIDGSFSDFIAEKYKGPNSEYLITPPDDWKGRAITDWIWKVGEGNDNYNPNWEKCLIRNTEILNRIYQRN